jgi:hypothetical protein
MKTSIRQGVMTLSLKPWLDRRRARALICAAIGIGGFFAPVAHGQTNGCAAAPAGLVSWWRGEGNTLDSVRTNHGSAVGGVTIVPGKVGNGLGFDGTGYVVVPHHPSLNCSNALTIELWYNSAQSNDVYYGIIDKRVGAVGANYGINVAAGAGLGVYYDDLAVQDGDDTASSFEASRYAPAPEPGVFHHLAATYRQISNNLVRLQTYIDGQNVRTRYLAGSLANTINSSPVTIGATAQGAGEFFQGVIDEVSIYNRVLSATELQSIYAAGAAGKCTGGVTNPPPTAAGVPVITSFSPLAAPVGTPITISGTNFSPVWTSNIVYFGATRAVVSAASPTSLVATLPVGATYAPISVTVNGQTALSHLSFLPTFAGTGTNITSASFAPGQNLTVADGPIKSVIADMDSDGKPDLVVANSYAHNVSLLRNISVAGTLDGSSFASRVDLPVVGGTDSPRCIAVADVDGDGKLDILIGDQATSSVLVYRNISTPGLLNAGSFAAPVGFPAAANSYPHGLRVADLNGDGRPEILVANQSGDSISILKNIGSVGSLTTNSFAPQTALVTGANPTDIGIGDFNGDGRPDLVTTAFNGSQLSVLRNVATPGAAVSNWFVLEAMLPALAGSLEITVTDLDGDAKSDLVVASVHGYAVSVFRNQATAGVFDTNSFAARVDYSAPGWVHSISVADFNGDAKPDIAAVGELNSYLAVFQNQSTPGSIGLGTRVDFGTGWNAWGVVAGDLDGDNRSDIVFANSYDDTLTFYRNIMGQGTNTNPPPTGCYNASDAFTTNSNPNGVWSYGFSPTLGDPVIPFFEQGNWGGLDFWRSNIWYNVPGIYFNPTSETIINPTSTIMLQPGQLALHPGPNGEFAVLRFTVPNDDAYQIAVEFTGADILGTTTDVHLLLNGSPQRSGVVDGFGSGSGLSINTNLFLRAGDHLDFAVGRGANNEFTYDATAVALQICATTNPPPGSCVPSPSGLVGWWRAEGNPQDSIGGNDGVLQNAVTFPAGQIGQAFGFYTPDAGVRIVAAPVLDVGMQNGFTIEAWINPADVGTGRPIVEWSRDIGGSPYGVHLWAGHPNHDPGYFFANIADIQGNWRVIDKEGVLTANRYQHVAVTYDAIVGLARLFVDGVMVQEANLGIFTPRTSDNLYIGKRPASDVNSRSFTGQIDEVSIYNRALSTNEIAAIFQAGSAGKCAPPAVAPRITQQPQSVSTNANSNVRFSVVASGLPQPGYQWYFAGNALFGQTNATLTLTSVQTNHAGSYYVVAANQLGAVTSSVVTLTVLAYPPIITVQPQDRITYAGKTVSFAVQATGTAPLRYQWSKNGTNILNATSQTLTLPNVQSNATGLYRVLVSNNYGSTNSRAAQLTVLPPPVCLPAPDGAIAWWPGESNTADVIGGFDATLLQSPPAYLLYTTGKVGAALNLGQFATYGSVTTGGGLNVNAGSGLTIEGWIRPNTYAVGPVAEWNDGRRNVGAGLLINSTGPGVIEATMTDTNIPGRFMALRSATYAVTNGVWQHVAMTYDKGSGLAALYVNGVPVAQTNIGSMTPSTSTDVYLGYRPSGSYSGARFNGALDEITLYNRALTPTELQAIVMADEAGKCPPPPIACQIPVTDIAGWWRGESNVLDSINLNHGFLTPSNLPAQYSYGAGRYGASFSTMMNSYPVVPAKPSLDVGNGDGLTVEAWVSYNSGLPIVEWNSGTGTQGVYIAYSSSRGPGYLEANLVDNLGQPHLLISPFISPVYQQWRHVAVTYDRTSGQAALFVNGAVVTQTNLGSFTPRTTGNLYFGYRPPGAYAGSNSRLSGWLDEIAVYRRALTASELRCVYRAGAAKYPAALACVLPAEGIVGWWRGESNLVDSVQSNHGVSAPGGMPIYTTGRVGRAITVGAGRYVTIRSSQSLDVGKGSGFTVETWINPTNTTPGTLFGWGDNYPDVALDYYSFTSGGASPNLQARLVDTNGVTRLVTTPGYLVKTGIWQHVALSYDRSSGWATIYLNGAPITATNLGTFTPRTSGSFNLGWRPGGNYISFSGAIDETAVYNRALSAPEINAIYQATTGRCIQPPVIVQVPANQRVNAGSNVTLTVVAEGNPLLRYQWGQNLSPAGGNIMLAGRTNASLTLTNVQAKDGGRYWIRVTNNFGMATASNILLTVNYGPVSKNLSLTTAEDTAQAFKLPVTDANQDPLLYTILTQPTNGTLSGTAPDLVYTPKPEFSGGDSFAFRAFDGLLNSAAATVAITVTPVNDSPIALSQIVATDEDLSLPITLGVTDVEGEALTFALTPPTHGILSGIAPNLVYTPHTNFYGDDLFTFTAQDASGGVSQVAAVSITVRSVNDAPVAKIEIAPLDELPGLTNTIAIAPVCCAATLRLDASLSSDAENDPLTYAWLAGTNVLSSEAITTNRFEPGTHEITLVVSDGHETVTKSITVEILTSSEAVGYLKLLVEAGVTQTRTRMPMLNWLRQAGDAFDRCHVEQGVHFLKMFKALVAERLSASDPDLATSLIETTEAILEAAPDCDPCHRLGRHHRKHGDGDRDGHGQPREERENSGRNQRDSEPKSNRGGQSRGDAERSAAAEIRAERSSPRAR